MSPPQIQPSEIGDLKFMDVNGDGVVNDEDIVDHRKIWGVLDVIEELEVYISEE